MVETFRLTLRLFNRRTRFRLALMVIGSLLASSLEVIGLVVIAPLIDVLTQPDSSPSVVARFVTSVTGIESSTDMAPLLAILVVGSFLVRGAATLAIRWWTFRFILRNEADVSTALLRRYLGAPYSYHLARNSAELINVAQVATDHTYQRVVLGFLILFTEGIVIVAVTTVLFVTAPLATMAALLYFSLGALAYGRILRTKANEVGAKYRDSQAALLKSLNQALNGIKEIIVSQSAQTFVEIFDDLKLRAAGYKAMTRFLAEIPRYYLEFLFVTAIGIVVLVTRSAGREGELVTLLALFVAAGFRVIPSLSRVLSSTTAIRTGRPFLDSLLTDLQLADPDHNPRLKQPTTTATPDRGRSGLAAAPLVQFDHVSFRFPGTDRLVLAELSFSIPAGAAVGVVGRSGAGKTTLVDLMLGLHDPSEGEIRVAGTPMRTVIENWRHCVGYVPQDVFLLDDSFIRNIAFGVPEVAISEADVARAVQLAQLDGLVAQLPAGLETRLGERGVRLSGGQRQRMGIARALYRQPSLLVLDEATSALDGKTESDIAETLNGLRHSLTTVIVAHRLTTVRSCDTILYLDRGVLVGTGTFDELVGTSEEFARLASFGDLNPFRGSA